MMARTSSSTLVSAILVVCAWTALIVPTQAASTFQWSFAFSMASTSLTQCQNYSITTSNRTTGNVTTAGVPPFYMIAFRSSDIPTTSLIGSDPNNLTWRVNQPSGSTLLLSVIDSLGNSGGNAPDLYSVSGGDSSCIPSRPSRNLTLASNVTGSTLQTCQNLGLRVYGGTMPYNVTIAALNSPVITNVSLGSNNDVLTYPNRVDPNTQFLVAVVDSSGWGSGTKLFRTTGSTNTDCTGLRTTAGNSSSVNQNPSPPTHSVSGGAIAGIVIAICAVLLLFAGAFLWLRRRKRIMQEHEPAYLPDAWTGPISVSAQGKEPDFSPYSDDSPRPLSKMDRYRNDMAQSRDQSWEMGSRPNFGYSHGRNDSANIGMALLSPADGSFGSGSGSGSGSQMGSSSRGKGRTTLPPGVPRDWHAQPDIIIQHQDAGVSVQEIPPPYVGPPSTSAAETSVAQRPAKILPSVPTPEPSAAPTSRPSSSGAGLDAGQSTYPGLGGASHM